MEIVLDSDLCEQLLLAALRRRCTVNELIVELLTEGAAITELHHLDNGELP